MTALPKYLKRLNLITGPLIKNSSHSHLGRMRNCLLCLPQFQGEEEFLRFGSALHEVFLEGRYDTYNLLTAVQQAKIDAMVTKLNRHAVVRNLMANSIREQKVYDFINGVELAFVLDIHQPHKSTGADLKTTTANNYNECVSRAVGYGYHKQAFVYKKLAKVKKFFFIFICKVAPYNIFIVDSDCAEFKTQLKYIEQELKFLLYLYKNYGNFITEPNGN
jgi:hypothetical protein